MKIYEITTRTPNEQLINSQLTQLYEAAVAATAASAAAPGIFSKAASGFMFVMRKIGLFYLLKPFLTYYNNMKTAEDNLKVDSSPEAQHRYNEIQAVQVGLLVSGVAAGFLTIGIFKSATAFLGFLKYIPFVGPMLVSTIELFSITARTYILKELSSEEGRTKLADLLVGTIVGTNTHINGVTGIGTGVVDAFKYFSNVINKAIDQENGAKPDETKSIESPDTIDKTSDKPASIAAPDTSSTPVVNAPNTAPAAKLDKKNPEEIDWTPQPGEEVYTPDGFGRSASGRLTLGPPPVPKK